MDEQIDLYDLSRFVEWSVGHVTFFPFAAIVWRDKIAGTDIEWPRPGCRIKFDFAVSFAYVNLSQTSEYIAEEDDCPPVLEELTYDGAQTFVDGFKYCPEAHGAGLRYFRINTPTDVFDVLSHNAPEITAMPVTPPQIQDTT